MSRKEPSYWEEIENNELFISSSLWRKAKQYSEVLSIPMNAEGEAMPKELCEAEVLEGVGFLIRNSRTFFRIFLMCIFVTG